MTKEHHRSDRPRPRVTSRRDFIKLAAMAGLLAGCRPLEKLVTPTSTPPPTPITEPSKVVHTRHAGVWDGEALVPEAIRQMLDTSIIKLTGLDDAGKAWAALFSPDERIAIKVNTIATSRFWTHVPLVMAVAECLQEAGIPAEQIIIFDRHNSELEGAGYPINKDGPGVRCYSTDGNYTEGWKLVDLDIQLSDILLNCDALINVPILKHHTVSGCTFAMKNHYGTFDRPGYFHQGRIRRAIAELNALPPIKDRTRLIIGDALTVCAGDWRKAVTWNSILMGFDPVAHDTVGLQVLVEARASEGRNSKAVTSMANGWLENAVELGLGTNDPNHIELMEVTLG
jgi:uncharacterized protein (DUF362 family)